MSFDEEDHIARRNLPYGRFHEGCHPDVLQRLMELVEAPTAASAQAALTLAKHATMGAEALGRAVARETQSSADEAPSPVNNLSRPA